MCPPDIAIKSEEVDDLADLCHPAGANAEDGVPAPLAPLGKLHEPSPNPKIEDDSDDVLTSLCALFDDMWPENKDDDSEDDDSSTETDCPSPRCRGLDVDFPAKNFFYTQNGLHFFDQDRNIYRLDEYGNQTLVYQGRPFDLDYNLLDGPFYIEGDMLPYEFDMVGQLWCNGTQVPLLELSTLDTSFDQSFNSLFNESYYPQVYLPGLSAQDALQALVSNGTFCDNTKAKVESDPFKTEPLHGSLQGRGAMPWSPSSAVSPIVTQSSRASSEALEPLIVGGPCDYAAGIDLWKRETIVAQGVRNRAPIDKMSRRRCPHCEKVFRRPSSLDDHLNVHTGAKPHMCPFERCRTGFATKSNMKRHFLTHQAGKLEDYVRGVKSGKSNPRTSIYNSKVFHTQRFRLVAA